MKSVETINLSQARQHWRFDRIHEKDQVARMWCDEEKEKVLRSDMGEKRERLMLLMLRVDLFIYMYLRVAASDKLHIQFCISHVIMHIAHRCTHEQPLGKTIFVALSLWSFAYRGTNITMKMSNNISKLKLILFKYKISVQLSTVY